MKKQSENETSKRRAIKYKEGREWFLFMKKTYLLVGEGDGREDWSREREWIRKRKGRSREKEEGRAKREGHNRVSEDEVYSLIIIIIIIYLLDIGSDRNVWDEKGWIYNNKDRVLVAFNFYESGNTSTRMGCSRARHVALCFTFHGMSFL